MRLGAHVCHSLISTLCVGDTLIIVTLGTIATCEALLVWFLCRAWQTRERRPVVVMVRPRSYPLAAHLAGQPSLDASRS